MKARAFMLAACGVLPLPQCAASAGPAEDDAVVLARTAQLSRWLGEPVGLGRSLCIQEAYALRWPGAQGPVDETQQDALRNATERCAAEGEGTRIVGQARRAFQERLARLSSLAVDVSSCRPLAGEALSHCIASVVGKRLTPEQERLVLEATAKDGPR